MEKRKFIVVTISEDRPNKLAAAICAWLEANILHDEDYTVSYAISAPEYSAIIVVRN